ncbi:hypothetical protein CIW49_28565 [Mycolicibacterium sp. P1-18]|uniref:hypothetical protein n=1 Tax=Mycolicibacterium sp. P1-18 TaxID=2024615 RepID=UPI0011F18C8E|nr:hypothetical protein [Mycolicibacterium sp. P1-18]KAA0092749.1 hypothetical protein CIW49_28565 [Mycolicibacterium sp. P1-18]
MDVSVRPWFTTGVALVGAGAIALTPISPMAPVRPVADVAQVSAAVSRQVELTALDWPYILSLPIIRQNILNTIENWAVYLGGFAKSGVGLTQSLLALPGVTIEALQQALALDFVGAFDTIATGVRDTVIAVGQPLLDSIIWRNQKAALVQSALSSAVPLAYISVVNGFLAAANGVTTSLIVGTQDFIAAVLTLNLGNIVNAALDGTRNFVTALGAGAGAIVDGIEAAQRGIAEALATTPPPPPAFFASNVADTSAMSTFSADNTLTLSRSAGGADAEVFQPEVTPDAPVVPDAEPVVADETPAVEAPDPTSTVPAPAPAPAPVKDADPTPDPVTPEKNPPATSVKDDVKDVKDVKDEAKEPAKVTAGAHATGNDKSAGATKDDDGAGAAAKPASGGDGGES